DQPDLLAALDRGGGLDEEKMMAVLLADGIDADHGARGWRKLGPPLAHCAAPAKSAAAVPRLGPGTPQGRWSTGSGMRGGESFATVAALAAGSPATVLSRRGRASTAVSPSFCSVAARWLTERRIHPACPSSVRNRTTALVVASVNTAMPPPGPVTVP